jgi:hypothetical protein
MDFFIEYLYGFTYIPSKCRDNRKGVGHATMKVEIAELEDADVPVVMTVGNLPGNAGHGIDVSFERFLRKADGSDRRVRIRDGYFYVEARPVEEVIEAARDIRRLNETFLANGVTGGRKPGLEPFEVRQKLEDIITNMWQLRRRGGLREDMTVDDRGAKVRQQITDQAARIFAVDGITYELCREPILVIKKKPDGGILHGIVESHASHAVRMDGRFQHHFTGCEWTSSLNHAAHVLRQADVSEPGVSFEVIDPRVSCYDGLASDIHLHVAQALNQLGRTITATSISALQVYYQMKEALSGIDTVSPSVSVEMVEAAEAVMSIAADPDVEEPMRQLANARYMTQASHTYRPAVNLDADTGFGLMLDHVSHYRDKGGHLENAREYASFALTRWIGRHPEAHIDNGASHRTATADGGMTVTELSSAFQVRGACREMGCGYDEMEASLLSGSRLFRVGVSRPPHRDLPDQKTVALVSQPEPGSKTGLWNVYVAPDHRDEDFLAIVKNHLQKMDELDKINEQDQHLISIF